MTFHEQVGTSDINLYRAAYISSVKRNAPALHQVIASNQAYYSTDCLDFLALSWAREGFRFHRNTGWNSSAFVRDSDTIVELLYESYLVKFLTYLNTVNMGKAVRMLGIVKGAASFELDPREITRRILELMPHACTEINIIQWPARFRGAVARYDQRGNRREFRGG